MLSAYSRHVLPDASSLSAMFVALVSQPGPASQSDGAQL